MNCPFTSNVHVFKELTERSRVLPEKLTVIQKDKKLSAFYGTRRLITMFIILTLILSPHLRLGPQNDLFPSEFRDYNFICISYPHACYVTSHFVLINVITLTIFRKKFTFWSSLLRIIILFLIRLNTSPPNMTKMLFS
jgi:hypothetical protein